MTDNNKIYFDTFIESLNELADEEFQSNIWTNKNNPSGLIASFTEAVINFFDDALVADALDNNQTIISEKVTHAIRELHIATDAVDEFRSAKAIIDDPSMEIVRKKAAQIIDLIKASDASENTVRLIKRGER